MSLGLREYGSGSAASLGARVIAFVLDLVALGLADLLVARDDYLAAVLAFLVVQIVPSVRWGSTLGQALVKLRVVPYVNGELRTEQGGLTVLTALARSLVWGCFPASQIIACVTLDADRRTLWDRMSDTVVVNR